MEVHPGEYQRVYGLYGDGESVVGPMRRLAGLFALLVLLLVLPSVSLAAGTVVCQGGTCTWVVTGGVTISGGVLTVPNGTVSAPSLTFSAGGGFYRKTGGGYEYVALSLNGQNIVALGSENAAIPAISLQAAASIGWSTNTNAASASPDLLLFRDAANILAQKNAASAQTFRVYGTTTGSKYISLAHDGTNPILGSSSGALKINSTAVTPATTGTRYLCIDTAGVVASSASACSGT